MRHWFCLVVTIPCATVLFYDSGGLSALSALLLFVLVTVFVLYKVKYANKKDLCAGICAKVYFLYF